MTVLFKVCVYGTLKRGEPNHNWFAKLPNAYYKFISECRTIEKYPLIIATRYNVPFVLDVPGVGHHVKGELYEVDEAMLQHLDVLEDHPNFYVREQRDIQYLNTPNETKIEKAWIYFIKQFKDEMLDRETFECYSSNGEHGLKYVEKYLRPNNGIEYRQDILKNFLLQ